MLRGGMSLTLSTTLADTLRVTVSIFYPKALILRGFVIVAVRRIKRDSFTLGCICAPRCLG